MTPQEFIADLDKIHALWCEEANPDFPRPCNCGVPDILRTLCLPEPWCPSCARLSENGHREGCRHGLRRHPDEADLN